jgi:hypothetical protein
MAAASLSLACAPSTPVPRSKRHGQRVARHDKRCEQHAHMPEAAPAGVHGLPPDVVARTTGCGLRRLPVDCLGIHTVAVAGERLLRCHQGRLWSACIGIRGLHG